MRHAYIFAAGLLPVLIGASTAVDLHSEKHHGSNAATAGDAKTLRGLRGQRQSVHGKRSLTDTQTVYYCNFIGCPNGFVPIDDAQNTPCDDNDCTVEQCCETYCSSFACPDGLIPIEGAEDTLCTDQECTQEQCCDAFCSGFGCPNGYIPIDDADKTLCENQECDAEQCCTYVG